MFNDPETRYWQQKYKENPNDPMFDDSPGETLALLGGTAHISDAVLGLLIFFVLFLVGGAVIVGLGLCK